MIWLSHPTVNANWRNLTLAIEEAGWLGAFHTTLAFFEGTGAGLPAGLRAEIGRRVVSARVAAKVVRHPWRETGRLLAGRARVEALVAHEVGPFSVDAVFLALGRAVARRLDRGMAPEAVVAGEDGALAIFRAAKRRGIFCGYELPIGYFEAGQAVIREERELCPAFAGTLPGMRDSREKLDRKREEAELADLVLAPSEFVRQSLVDGGIGAEKISVVPYGAPVHLPARTWAAEAERGPLRVLFAGAINQRKGIGYLLEGLKRFRREEVSLTLLGTLPAETGAFAAYRESFTHVPSRPHAQVMQMMREHDVLVLPSLFEGFALVILEAMAAGIPVIVTPNSGALPVVRHGVDGFVIPIRSAEAIAESVGILLADRARLVEMGRNARARAEAWSWERYRADVRCVLGAALEGSR